MYDFAWTTIDTNIWSYNWVLQNENISKTISYTNVDTSIFTNYLKSISSLNESWDFYFDLWVEQISWWWSSCDLFSNFILYFNSSNYINIRIRLYNYNNTWDISLISLKWGIVESTQSISLTSVRAYSFKLSYNKTSWWIKLFYWQVWTTPITQVWTEFITTLLEVLPNVYF